MPFYLIPFTSRFSGTAGKTIQAITVGGAGLMLLGDLSQGYWISAFRYLTWALAEVSGQINESNFQEQVSERCASAALGLTSRYRFLTLTGSILSMVSHWDAVQIQLLALTCYPKQMYGIWEITLWDSSLLVISQNADNTYEVSNLSNFSMQGWLCAGEANFTACKAGSEEQTLCNFFLQCLQSKGAEERSECRFSLQSWVPC